MINFSDRLNQINDRIERMTAFKGNIETILLYLSESKLPQPVINEVVGYLLLTDLNEYIVGKKAAIEYHASKYFYGKYAKDTQRRWVRLSMYSRPTDWDNVSKWIDVFLLATSFWNKTIKADGHLIMKTSKNTLARSTTQNFLRPKYHYGEFMRCPACGSAVKLVFRQNKLFALAPESRYFQCRQCGWDSNEEDVL